MKERHMISDAQAQVNITLTDTQIKAINLCLDTTCRVATVTGSAGTGKTVILKYVADHLVQSGYTVALAAPTGKAAKRITEATGYEATTLHRLLRYPLPNEVDPATGAALDKTLPAHRRSNPLDADFVLVDEYAMVNHEMHRNLLNALKPGGIVRMFGDINQLRPIETLDILKAKESPFSILLSKFPCTVLDVIHRQAAGSGILSNGALINKGKIPKRQGDFKIHITGSPVHKLKELINQENYGLLRNQVITPAAKSWVGSYKLNLQIQTTINPSVLRMPLARNSWHKKEGISVGIGDKVIISKNDYQLNMFNGETGIILDITENESIVVDFKDRIVEIPCELLYIDKHGSTKKYDPRVSIDLAFAITTHKAQGSEYDNVIYVLNKGSRYIQCRSNFYTGITRAKKQVHLISDQYSLTNSVVTV